MTLDDEERELRQAAEARLRAGKTLASDAGGEADLARLVQELQIHQIELEMQNSELRTTRIELEAALTRYTDLYDFAPIGYFSIDLHGRIEQANLAGARLLDAHRGRLTGCAFADFVASESRPRFAEMLQWARDSRARESCEIVLAAADRNGSARHAHVESMFSDDGATCRLAVLDTTAARTAEEALRERSENLRTILSATPDIVCTVDRQYRILYVNRVVAGLQATDVMGRDATAFAEREHQAIARSHIDQVFATGAIGRFEVRGRGENAQATWYETIAAPVFRGRHVETVTLLSRDISARKRVAEELDLHRRHLEELVAQHSRAAEEPHRPTAVQQRGAEGNPPASPVRLTAGPARCVVPATGLPVSAEDALRRDHHGARVLLAEDDEIIRLVAGELLQHCGLRVDFADDGLVAVALAQRQHYDLVLMDLQMPQQDGIAAAQAIRRLPGWAATPIIAMTASALDDDRRACIDAGMNDHLAKPATPEELYATALRWLSVRAEGQRGKR